MDKLKTATGKQYQCDYFNPCHPVNRLTIRIVGTSIVDVATVFSDSKETEVLLYGNACVEQYSSLVSIMPEGEAIRVTLKKE